MTDSIDRRFDRVSKGYAQHRPVCPSALVEKIVSRCASRELAWEPGCGSGQVTRVLSPLIRRTVATDPAEQAIARAPELDGVTFAVGSASSVDLPDDCVDLIASGQSAHWFEPQAFAAEATRIGKKGAVVALWCYDRPRVMPAVDACIDQLYYEVLAGMWDRRRSYIDDRYRSLPFPFEEEPINVPQYEARWHVADMLAYLRTWSAVDAYAEVGCGDAVGVIEDELQTVWGDDARQVCWPVGIRAGRIHR
ncbi:MAG: class I SAM-dependent methyltransferase [Phycisphaerales bacterium]|nr:class I SAM-dependent methyltransferase [Phycisphaerales bacterium]